MSLREFAVDVARGIMRNILGVEKDHSLQQNHWWMIGIGYQKVKVPKITDSVNYIQ